MHDAAQLPVIFQDRWLMVVNKPSGLPSQAPRGGGDNAYDRLRREHRYVGLHHRLDTPASGLLLFTLHKHANAGAARGFREHTIQRSYWLVVLGETADQGSWSTDVGGRSARTDWTRLATRDGLSLLSARLHTGRRHQLRIQSSDAGHPIIGDRRHGGAAGSLWSRLALHAERLELTHPVTGESLILQAPAPDDLAPDFARWARSLQANHSA